MKIKITPKTPGNRVNARKGMSGKAHGVITAQLEDGMIIEGKLSRNGEWYKTPAGYVRAPLAVEAPDGE